ncbi:MAG: TerB family tellurite resistance protein [Deltaproteobacteria bacterium]|nr:TerB family tellurite resistance protein [Deltaproteobacteria bacterium]
MEAMLCAMGADGKIHEQELASMQRHIEEHEMFDGLSERHHTVLIDIARDAIAFADTPIARIPAIAKGLPSRLHKLTALAMACEVVVADTEVDQKEVIFLKTLRRALRIGREDFEEMFLAAQEKRSTRDLDVRVAHLRALVPTVVALFALRSLAVGNLTPPHRLQIVELLAAIPDLQLREQDLATLAEKAYERVHFSMDLEAEVQKVASSMPGPVDRYWATVYLMCADTVTASHWRTSPFFTLIQRAFELDPADMDLAAGDATGFGSLPRVG